MSRRHEVGHSRPAEGELPQVKQTNNKTYSPFDGLARPDGEQRRLRPGVSL